MRFNVGHAALLAALLFLALLAFRIFVGQREAAQERNLIADQPSIQITRKNYATAKLLASAGGLAAGDGQKYEKVATLTELTSDYDADRKRIDSLVAAHQGIVQFEQATGLTGRRALSLGIGVPPDRFDAFVGAAQAIGKSARIEIIKNDKTNEYLQLRAQRAALEKAHAGIEMLAPLEGSIDERIHLQEKLTEIDQHMQELAVSLGEFDSQNELCTVKLTLREMPAAASSSWTGRVAAALAWTAIRYAFAGVGFLCLVLALWLIVPLARAARRLAAVPAT
jgi:hypothetical protein